MSEPIKVGDLVMMVRGHECGLRRIGGIPHRVLEIHPQTGGGWHCGICRTGNHAPNEMWGASLVDRNKAVPLGWLKRIPPLDELEGEKRDEAITA